MSDVIHLLPDSVANQIAAGEVIQRPASVIKELVENAVDAGADNISIVLRDGGKNLIQVIDDGCGMSPTDARLAFERHATSKITQAADLFELTTMGFRGEALPSIAAVAQVEMHTMRSSDAIGTCLNIAASKFESQTPQACQRGTNIAVKNLFFNFPARRKFLKKDSVELNHILHEFERLALVNPSKGFSLMHNDVTLHRLLPGTLKQRIVELFGRNLDKQLIPVHTETSLVKINGFVSLPENARKRNALQYFFVNGRNMKHPYFQKAVLHCYEELIASDHQPNFFLSFEVDPQTIDVNIHPTKNEIKFENEAPIWQILVAAIKEALGKFNAVPSIDFESAVAIDIPAFDPNVGTDFNPIEIDPDYNPFAQGNPEPQNNPLFNPVSSFSPSAPRTSVQTNRGMDGSHSTPQMPERSNIMSNWEQLYEGFRSDNASLPPSVVDKEYNPFHPEAESEANSSHGNVTDEMPVTLDMLGTMEGDQSQPSLLQFNNRYFVVSAKSGIMVIDRYRAHVKVLYERFIKYDNNSDTQQMMFPETITLSLSQHVTLDGIIEDVRALGFDLAYLGDHTWGINGIPGSLGKINVVDTLYKIIDSVEGQTSPATEGLRRNVALSLAYAAAIGRGQVLTTTEADALLGSFLALRDPMFTPDGKRIFFIMDENEIAKKL